MKIITVRGVQVNKPDNISITLIKKVIDELGKDYCITVDAIIQFLSKQKPMKKFAVAVIIAKIKDGNVKPDAIASQLYIVNSPSKEKAKQYILDHNDLKEAVKLGWTIINSNVAEA